MDRRRHSNGGSRSARSLGYNRFRGRSDLAPVMIVPHMPDREPRSAQALSWRDSTHHRGKPTLSVFDSAGVFTSPLRDQDYERDDRDRKCCRHNRPAGLQTTFGNRLVEEVADRRAKRTSENEGRPKKEHMADPSGESGSRAPRALR